jgi:hypothetical protein
MLQKDYWRMSEKDLRILAERYYIPPESMTKEDPDDPETEFYFDRDRVINALLVRDNALRTKWTIAISILALLVSITSLVISILKSSK